jgi:hypothetical protein
MEASKIVDKYVETLKRVHDCGADVIMDSVWRRILHDFYIEISSKV